LGVDEIVAFLAIKSASYFASQSPEHLFPALLITMLQKPIAVA